VSLDVLVIGAGPYGLAAAKAARDRGLETRVVGKPMGFWREHMPAGMLLRSGPDWHLDPAGELTFEAFESAPPDPIPLQLYLDYADWFQREAGIVPEDEEVVTLTSDLTATFASGERVQAGAVVAAPGIARFTHRPQWATEGVHTCDLTGFEDFAGADVLIVGGRQSAYESAALLAEHGAQVHVVHRHPQPRFAQVSWRFVDRHIDDTLATRDWWRGLPQAERDRIGRQFWEVGRLTLEPWLAPRIQAVHVHANAEVIEATARGVRLSDGTRLAPDRIVFATGYRAEVTNVPYLPPLASKNGFPVLDAAMQASVPGLYLPGFTATQDFGPFFGFVKGAPAAATLIARDLRA
jgi:cation diffusion facilitator CzcD-associated flavoprotein CzcO